MKDKNNIVYEINCSTFKVVYLSEYFNRALKLQPDEHKRSTKNYNCEKNEIGKHNGEEYHNLDQKKVVDRKNRLIARKIKETINSLSNSKYINKIAYILLESRFPNLP